ncbi:hypothetical protein SUGI_0518960 [Cryptomeria japonica]|nr:hypothetical protein SUGI_0518960 [Cryptomeria japonica]
MLIEGNVLKIYWKEAISTTVSTFNKVYIKGDIGKTPSELWFGHVPIVDENLGKEIRACCYDDGQHVVLAPIQIEEPKQNDLVEIVKPDVVAAGAEVQEPDNLNNQKTPSYVRLNHSKNQIIGDKNKGVMTRRRLATEEVCLISKVEPKDVVEACKVEN